MQRKPAAPPTVQQARLEVPALLPIPSSVSGPTIARQPSTSAASEVEFARLPARPPDVEKAPVPAASEDNNEESNWVVVVTGRLGAQRSVGLSSDCLPSSRWKSIEPDWLRARLVPSLRSSDFAAGMDLRKVLP